MSRSLCRISTETDYTSKIHVWQFVYETEYRKLAQPFFSIYSRIFLVTSGNGILKINDKCYNVWESCVFVVPVATFHELHGSDDLEYMYISFSGESVVSMFKNFSITRDNPVYYNLDHLKAFWFTSIRKVVPKNFEILTKSVLYYTISELSDELKTPENRVSKNTFDTISDYINLHYADLDFSLKKVSHIFFYSPKYLSSVFKERTGLGFKEYVTDKRIKKAISLIESEHITSITEIARQTGYSDPQYFSKVFKKVSGKSPTSYIAK